MSERRALYAVQSPTVQERTRVIDGKTVDVLPKCAQCGRTLGGYAARPYSLRCRRCKADTERR